MKWLIGVDLRETATGALHFAQWLVRESAMSARPTLLPVHVLEESYLMQVLRHRHYDDVEQLARMATVAQLDRAEIGGVADPARVVRGIEASECLVSELDATHADALIIGRQAPAPSRELVRLGRIARRLVRRLPCPVVVVPPELRFDTIGKGPILLATDLDATTGSAARFAGRVAQSTGRPLWVVTVVEPSEHERRYLPDTTTAELDAQAGLDRQRALQSWIAANHLTGATGIVAYGDIITRLSAMAASEDVPLVITGSRVLGTLERIFTTSVGTDLACWSKCAVAIVPPTWGG